jgi:fumarate hydratase class I
VDTFLKEAFLQLILKCSSSLPEDIELGLKHAYEREEEKGAAKAALKEILENTRLAREKKLPLCQDTGTNIWYVYYPYKLKEAELRDEIIEATKEGTRRYYLRPNAVDPITGTNTKDNTGPGMPQIHFHQWEKEYIQVDLLLKGGGSENVSEQYKLPDIQINAGRDLEGVKHAVIDAVHKAQGLGCAPGIIGIGIGGDRSSSYLKAKEQLFRPLEHKNPNPLLDELERDLLEKLNSLGIGAMGYGGKTTVLGVKASSLCRVPASYFVSIAYMCWACRRASLAIKDREIIFLKQAYTGIN